MDGEAIARNVAQARAAKAGRKIIIFMVVPSGEKAVFSYRDKHQPLALVPGRQRMIPKSGNRFSEKITRKQRDFNGS
jgi:hypothetical protein